MKLVNWIKRLLALVRRYESEMVRMHQLMSELDDLVRSRTEVHASIAYSRRDESYMILIGQYKGTDYVECFNIGRPELHNMIHRMKEQRKHGGLGRVDAPPMFRAVIKEEWQR
jgi:hypothetical protein